MGKKSVETDAPEEVLLPATKTKTMMYLTGDVRFKLDTLIRDRDTKTKEQRQTVLREVMVAGVQALMGEERYEEVCQDWLEHVQQCVIENKSTDYFTYRGM